MSSANLRQWMNAKTVPPANDESQRRVSDILILDGGVSTHLEQLIVEQKRHEETTEIDASNNESFQYRTLWSSSLLLNENGQDLIQQSHKSFLDSGCDIISTVTYQLSHHVCQLKDQPSLSCVKDDGSSQKKLKSLEVLALSESDVDELLSRGIQLAHETRIRVMEQRVEKDTSFIYDAKEAKPLYVIGSMGCYGAALADGSEYRGDYDIGTGKLIQFHKRRFSVMMDWVTKDSRSKDHSKDSTKREEQHIDGVAFETVPNITEVEAIINVVQERLNKNISEDEKIAIWISLACQNEHCLNDGTPLIEVLDKIEALDENGFINGIGVNCFDVKKATSLIKEIATHQVKSKFNRAIIFYPNSGEEWDASNETWLEGSGCTDSEIFTEFMMDAIRLVQTTYKSKHKQCRIIVGGCCRTRPGTIKNLRQKVDEIV